MSIKVGGWNGVHNLARQEGHAVVMCPAGDLHRRFSGSDLPGALVYAHPVDAVNSGHGQTERRGYNPCVMAWLS